MVTNRVAVLVVCAGNLMWAGAAMGASPQVLPAAFSATEGSSSNTIPIGGSGGRFMVMYGTDQLTGVPLGSVITAIEMRQSNGATAAWPVSQETITDYSIFLATSSLTPATMSTTFDTNVVGRVQVRGGPLNLEAGAYPGTAATGTTPEPWGRKFAFNVEYVYNGGPLVIEFRNSGGAGSASADAQASTAGFASVGTTVSPVSASGFAVGALVTRISFRSQDLAKGVTKVIVGENQVDDESSTSSFTLAANSARTQMAVVNANQFDTIGSGSDIVGMTWRTTGGWTTTWPQAGGGTYSKFDVQLSRSQNAPGALSTTIALNVGGDARMVRSGALSIPLASFPTSVGQSTGAFGGEIAFTDPYPYKGGPLLSVIRHDGQPGDIWALSSISQSDPDTNVIVQSFRNNSSSVAATATDPSSTEITRYSVDAATTSPRGAPSPLTNGGVLNFGGRIYQTILSATELRDIPVGSVIDSLWLRRPDSFPSAGPPSDWSATDLEVFVSSATTDPATMSLTFATNEGSDQVQVHDGPHVVAEDSIPGGVTGNFGKLVQFQKHFVYRGGPLCIRIRQVGTSSDLGPLECIPNAGTTNRSIFSTIESATGGFYAAPYTGTSMKLGYIASVMVPNSLANVEGVNGREMASTAEYAAQVIIGAEQLRAIDVGSAITGFSLRNSSSGATPSFPLVDTSLARFDVTMSRSARTPLNASTTFATNTGAGAVLVRSGAMKVPVHAYPATGVPNVRGENAWYVPFDRAYVYTGGDLCVTIRSEGLLGAGFFDTDGTSPTAAGAMLTALENSDALTSTDDWGSLAMRFAYTARAYCPWDLNNDGVVEDADFSIFVGAYNTLDCADAGMPTGCPADFNYSRVVDDADFSLFIVAYNELVCP